MWRPAIYKQLLLPLPAATTTNYCSNSTCNIPCLSPCLGRVYPRLARSYPPTNKGAEKGGQCKQNLLHIKPNTGITSSVAISIGDCEGYCLPAEVRRQPQLAQPPSPPLHTKHVASKILQNLGIGRSSTCALWAGVANSVALSQNRTTGRYGPTGDDRPERTSRWRGSSYCCCSREQIWPWHKWRRRKLDENSLG